MTQVFFVPPTPERVNTGKISIFLHVLYSLPAVVQILVVYNDYSTLKEGLSISTFATSLLLSGESVFLGAVIVLTIFIQGIVVELRGTWRKQFNKLFAAGAHG
jgi:hypothetical protein